MRLEIPEDASLVDVSQIGLPLDWKSEMVITQALGMQWLKSGSSLGLWVPSFIEPAESNLLLNPMHPAYSKIQLVIEKNPFTFDPRLF